MTYLKDCIVIERDILQIRLKICLEQIKLAKKNGGIKDLNQLSERINDIIDLVNNSKPLSDIMNRTLSTHTDFTENDIKNYLNEIRL
jgi:hypothetical protein